MFETLRLLLPALIPSWRFFKSVEPSPRVQWCADDRDVWLDYHQRPQNVAAWTMLARLFWNPVWNEALYIVSLAERLVIDPSGHAEDEVFRLLVRRGAKGDGVRFRVVMVTPQTREVMFASGSRKL